MSLEQPITEPYAKVPLPNYDAVPLRREIITVAAFQTKHTIVDPKNPRPGVKAKLDHVLSMIDMIQARGYLDLICFPEFVLQGSAISFWTREDFIRLAIDFPGEETERICQKAKQYNCYIEMAAYTIEKEWPGHFFNCSFIAGPNGEIIHKHWKAHWDPGLFEHSTSVHDVLDEFVERYGWEAVWPVARTDIGNIATLICSEGFQPETARAFAFKGAEILAYSISGGAILGVPRWGDARITFQASCINNDVYGIFVNNATGTTNQYALEDTGAGYSMIVDNLGRILKQATSQNETVVAEAIPIGLFRRNHTIPPLRQELYLPVYTEYKGKYPPNIYAEYLPKDNADALNYARKKARW